MTDMHRPSVTLGLGQIDTVVRWALKDAIKNMEVLSVSNMLGERERVDANLAAMKVAYAYFGGEAEEGEG